MVQYFDINKAISAYGSGQKQKKTVDDRRSFRDFAQSLRDGNYDAGAAAIARTGDVNGAMNVRNIPVTDQANQLGNEYTRTRIDDVGIDNQRADRSLNALEAHRQKSNARLQAESLIRQGQERRKLEQGNTANNLKLFGQEQDLRKEYSGRAETKDFNKVLSAFKKVRGAAAMDSGAGDMSLIFGYMKMLDPGSTVREGEFATAQNSGGVDDKVRGIYNQIISGTRLSSDQRRDFVQSAQGMYETHADTMRGVQDEYQAISDQWGVDPSRVFQPAPAFEPMQVGKQAPTSDGGYVKRIK